MNQGIASAYRDRWACLATMHHKEAAIALPFADRLGLSLVVPELDTDQLGTFSGEVDRQGTALQTAVRKCQLGMMCSGLPFGIASEGSFGPDPVIPFVTLNVEVMVFIDEERGITVHDGLLSHETNFAHVVAGAIEPLESFLEQVRFPSHALVVRPNVRQSSSSIFKGVRDFDALMTALAACSRDSEDGMAWVETDMRAHMNPTRMGQIARLAERLAERLATPCPHCGCPGWGKTGVEIGLPCEYCETETQLVRVEVFSCAACQRRDTFPRSDGLCFAEPVNCPYCNP